MRSRAVTWWLLTLIWCGVIFGLTAAGIFSGASTARAVRNVAPSLGVKRPTPQWVQATNRVVRKSAHVVVFAVLGATALQAVGAWPAPRAAGLWAWGFAAAYAVSDEVHQRFVFDRSGTVKDVAIDSVAAAVAILVLAALAARRARKETAP
jgi:VanZ family protein